MSGLIGLFLGFIALVVVLIIIAVLIKLAEEPKKKYGIASVTLNGENVRSIGEKKIADYFSRNNIMFMKKQYFPLIIDGLEFPTLISFYPIIMSMSSTGVW